MYRVLLTLIIGLFLFSANVVSAADCEVVYGGGKTECATAPVLTPVPTSTPTPQPTHSSASGGSGQAAPSTQSKGGLPIHPKTEAKTTPATGPEALGLIGLIPTAGLGFWLRKKTK